MYDKRVNETLSVHGTLENDIFNRSGLAMVRKAALFAEACHIHQSRKYTRRPYFEHVSRVADLVKDSTGDVRTIAAAYLHDTVEDTSATLGEIGAHFGPDVRGIVDTLTEGPWPGMNRKHRKLHQAERLRDASPRAMTVKYADILDNTPCIMEHDPAFGKLYLTEVNHLMTRMDAGDQFLRNQALTMLRLYE